MFKLCTAETDIRQSPRPDLYVSVYVDALIGLVYPLPLNVNGAGHYQDLCFFSRIDERLLGQENVYSLLSQSLTVFFMPSLSRPTSSRSIFGVP